MNFHRTNGTFAFAPTTQADPSAKAKEPFFSQRTDTIVDNIMVTFYLNK
jgi:hypothetical protein